MYFKEDNFHLNADVEKRKFAHQRSYPLSDKEYIALINRFKEAYEDIQLQEMNYPVCTIEGNRCYAKGEYDISLSVPPSEKININGDWMVELEFDDFGFWEIVNVQVEGINF